MPPKRPAIGARAAPAPAPRSAATQAISGQERQRQEVLDLQLREIMPNRFQPRTQPSAEGLDDLAASIRLHGVLEPIIVRPIPLTAYEGTGRRYELVAGERRWRASTLAERTTIPALVLPSDTTNRTMLELAITENLQREDLHPFDEALAFGRMQQELSYSYAQIAERLGKSKGYVQNRMRLLDLDEELQQLVAERPDTLGHVYELSRVSEPTTRARLIAAVRDEALSRAALRTEVQALLEPAPPATAPTPFQADPTAAQEPKRLLGEGVADTPVPQEAGQSYFQKYDGDAIHEENSQSRAAHAPAVAGQSYFQKYDGDAIHEENSQSRVAYASEAAVPTPAQAATNERGTPPAAHPATAPDHALAALEDSRQATLLHMHAVQQTLPHLDDAARVKLIAQLDELLRVISGLMQQLA